MFMLCVLQLTYIFSTWGDQNFDTVSGVPQGKMATETVTTGVVNVPASQAVLVTFADRPTSLGCGI